ncbi:MAG: (Fe-S)-binding protein [Thermoanaerobacteraceae bacterium]|nr:(Fe-S)-binding protein [Thermoanaerobacteraceae bacterium]
MSTAAARAIARKRVTFKDISRPGDEPLCWADLGDLMEVPYLGEEPLVEPTPQKFVEKYETSLDGYCCIGIPKPQTKEEEDFLVRRFLSGLEKLFSSEDSWTFQQVLRLSFDYCVKCQTCADACHAYIASGRQEIYRPTYRSEILRRIWKKYFTPEGKLLGGFVGADVEVNWRTVTRLAELGHRCTLCRRCAQRCPIGVDNAIIARELRKLFSQELGIAPVEILEKGCVQHLRVGSSTGMNPPGLKDAVEFMEDDIGDRIGKKVKIPVDKKGADILLIHNAGEFLSWPENPEAFAILFDAAGISWTLSSEPVGYDAVNYGLWNDDVELARVAVRHTQIAKKLGVKKVVIGECGHATKAYVVIADRVLAGDLSSSEIPRESCLPLLWEIIRSGAIKFDPSRNNFPVTLHDPCNMVRAMGIVQPQRLALKAIAPQFREMAPNGVFNYCCGGGSGYAIIQSFNFPQWRNKIGFRMKMRQTLEAFKNELDPEKYPFKYLCAPCSNCKGTIRDGITHYGLWDRYRLNYGGLVELMVNAMVDIDRPFIEYDDFH